jgi:hypothetical protein
LAAAGGVVGAAAGALGEHAVKAIAPANMIETNGSRGPDLLRAGYMVCGTPFVMVDAPGELFRRALRFVP